MIAMSVAETPSSGMWVLGAYALYLRIEITFFEVVSSDEKH